MTLFGSCPQKMSSLGSYFSVETSLSYPTQLLLQSSFKRKMPPIFCVISFCRDEFGPKYFGPGLKRAMEIMARPDQGPKPMLAFGPGRAWAKFKIDGPGWAGPKFENILKKITFSLVFQFKIAKYDVFHNF